jgi:hypothetical protein
MGLIIYHLYILLLKMSPLKYVYTDSGLLQHLFRFSAANNCIAWLLPPSSSPTPSPPPPPLVTSNPGVADAGATTVVPVAVAVTAATATL